MRVGIDFRLLSYGRAHVNRGMGRFTQQQLREVLRLASGDEFVLLVDPGHDPELLLPEIAAAANVSRAELPPDLAAPGLPVTPWSFPAAPAAGPTTATLPTLRADTTGERDAPPRDLLRQSAALGALFADLGLDLFHASTPLAPATPDFWRCDGCALVATHYDLIPLLYPGHYFGAGNGARRGEESRYRRAASALRFADRLLAISQFARREAADHLGYPEARIDVAHPVADPCFRRLPPGEAEARLAGLRRRCRLDGEFVLAVSHLHHAKNLRTLLAAYALLPPPWRRRHPLVVAGDFDAQGLARLDGWLRDAGIAGETAVPGFVADEELAALYNAALCCVHPSRYEGFALPVLEAMSCGAPVVAGGTSAPVEVLDGAGLLVDAEDPAALARAMARLGDDGALRAELQGAGLARAAAFTPEGLGRATLDSYRRALAETAAVRTRPARRRRLAIWSPLPPQPTGVADYTAELTGELGRWADCELFVDDAVWPAPEVLDAWPVFHHGAFVRRDRWRRFDLVIYQMGASMFHLYMTEAVRQRPGLLVLHDLTWGYVRFDLYNAGWPPAEVRRDLLEGGGQAALSGYDAIATLDTGDRTAPTEAFLDRHMLLGALVGASLAQVVHLPRAPRELAALYPQAHVHGFPMGVEDPWLALDGGPGVAAAAGEEPLSGAPRAALRRQFDLPPGAFVVGVFGIVDPVKRVESAIRAIARLGAAAPPPLLVIAGRFRQPAYRRRILELAAELGVAARVRLFEDLAKPAFHRLLLACDAVVNLRFPFRKQMSATLMRAVAAGKPVAVSAVPDWDHFPASFCCRIPPGDDEAEALAAWLSGLAGDPAGAEAAGRAAREYYRSHATLERMSEHYRDVIDELIAQQAASGAPTPPGTAAAVTATQPSADGGRDAPGAAGASPAPAASVTAAGSSGAADPASASGSRPPIPPPNPDPAPASASRPSSSPRELEAAFARWDEVRSRSSLRLQAQGALPARAIGFLRRTARRIRDLGIAWDRESELLRALLDAVAAQHAQAAEIAAARGDIAAVRGDIAELAAGVERLAQAQAESAGAAAEIQQELAIRQHALAARFSGLALRQQAAEDSLLEHSHGLLAMEERLAARGTGAVPPPATGTAHPAPSSSAVPEASPQPAGNGAGGAGGFDRDLLARLLAALERQVPAMAQGVAVEVTVHGANGELRQVASEHFGERLSEQAAAYRYPNDSWVHIDMAAGSPHPVLLDNAAGRLARGGCFLLVTPPGEAAPAPHPRLRLASDLDLTASLGTPARVLVWEKV
jgi:glycosyltransferase involved in cell wall biosynthesis